MIFKAFSIKQKILSGLLLCAMTSTLPAIEGIDTTTGGEWNTPTTPKPWSYDGQNRYGTAGYHFFNVTPPGGNKQTHRPVYENLKSKLPPYVAAIIPMEDAYTANSFGYLNIDSPSNAAQVESGVLARLTTTSHKPVKLLEIRLGKIKKLYGFRLGIFVGNTDRHELTPRKLTLSTADKSWSRSVFNLPQRTEGLWVFLTVPARHANQTLTLSAQAQQDYPVTIGGLVFDNLVDAPPARPLNVTSNQAVSQSGHVIWNVSPSYNIAEVTDITWDKSLTRVISTSYQKNETRLQAITDELKQLPLPYAGEPTGTGGYLSHALPSKQNHITINFYWQEPVTVDAMAFFPLRLFLAEENGLTENAYWPGKIQIHSVQNKEATLLQTLTHSPQTILPSLPELSTFEPHTTQHLKITLTNLREKLGTTRYAAGFAELCIFSAQDNIAPRARITASSSREGFRIYSKDYLIDGHTPLGLPEVGPRQSGGLGLSIRTSKRTPEHPIPIRLNFEQEITIDAVRIDPAVIYKPGQAFPVRFSVDLLGSGGSLLQRDATYQSTPLRSPGSNPHISYFPATRVKTLLVLVHEVSQPTLKTRPWIQISEITPMHRGNPVKTKASINPTVPYQTRSGKIYDPSGRQLYWDSETVYDGHTQTGKVLPMRQWVEKLYLRKQLILEQERLQLEQQQIVQSVHGKTLWGTIFLITILTLTSIYLIVYNQVVGRMKLRQARERIASDLHDDVGSNLSTITLHTEFLEDHIQEPAILERLKAIKKLTHESVYGLREVLHTSAPRIGRAQNLLQYMEELSRLVLPDVERKLDFDPAISGTLKTPALRKGVLLYYKEAITNIQTHSRCREVFVSFYHLGDHLELIIVDDGVGMTTEKLAQESTLRTLKLRANQMNGALKIESKPDKGTRLELNIPL